MSKFASFMSAVGTIASVVIRAAEENKQQQQQRYPGGIDLPTSTFGNRIETVIVPTLTAGVTYCGDEWVFTRSKMTNTATDIVRSARAAGVPRNQIDLFASAIDSFAKKMFFDHHDVVLEQYSLYTGQTMYRLICDNQMVSLTF